MLFYSVFQTFHSKNDSQKGPLGSYLCDITSCSFDHVSVSFLWNKESQKDFLPDEKNLIFLSFLRSIFLFPVFLCSFIFPFMEDSVIFIKLIFNFLLFFIVDLRHVFATFLLIITTVVFSLNVVHNHSKYLFCSFLFQVIS